MSSIQEFNDLQMYWQSLREIDRIKKRESKEDRLIDVMNAVKEISLNEFDDANMERIIEGIRGAVEVLYMNKLLSINSTVHVDVSNIANFLEDDRCHYEEIREQELVQPTKITELKTSDIPRFNEDVYD